MGRETASNAKPEGMDGAAAGTGGASGSVEPLGRMEFAHALASAGAISRHLPATEIARKSHIAEAAIIGHSAAAHWDLVDVIRRAGRPPLYQLSQAGRALMVADMRATAQAVERKGRP